MMMRGKIAQRMENVFCVTMSIAVGVLNAIRKCQSGVLVDVFLLGRGPWMSEGGLSLFLEMARLELRNDSTNSCIIVISEVLNGSNEHLTAYSLVAFCKHAPDLQAEYQVRFLTIDGIMSVIGLQKDLVNVMLAAVKFDSDFEQHRVTLVLTA